MLAQVDEAQREQSNICAATIKKMRLAKQSRCVTLNASSLQTLRTASNPFDDEASAKRIPALQKRRLVAFRAACFNTTLCSGLMTAGLRIG